MRTSPSAQESSPSQSLCTRPVNSKLLALILLLPDRWFLFLRYGLDRCCTEIFIHGRNPSSSSLLMANICHVQPARSVSVAVVPHQLLICDGVDMQLLPFCPTLLMPSFLSVEECMVLGYAAGRSRLANAMEQLCSCCHIGLFRP